MKISPKQYAVALYEAVKDKKKDEVKSAIENFTRLVYVNNDIFKVNKIISEFEKIWNREKGIVEAEIISARELDKTANKLLHDFIVSLLSAREARVNNLVDKTLLGGVVLKYGDKVLDGSMKTKLNELKLNMLK